MRAFVQVCTLTLHLHLNSLIPSIMCAIDGFGVAQLYAIIVLPNGGPDLETFAFAPSGKNSWAQACSIFWQITRALSEAEDVVHFEVRISPSTLVHFVFYEIDDLCAPSIGTSTGAKSS